MAATLEDKHKEVCKYLGKPSKKKFIFSDFVRKGEGGGRTKPIFLYKDNLGSNFKGRGAKLLFSKSKFHLVWFLGLYPNFILSQSHMFCSGTGD